MKDTTNLKLRLNELFQRWKVKPPTHGLSYHDEHIEMPLTIDHHTKGFITDGVVCPEEWIHQKRKILFILKEAYCDKATEFDLAVESAEADSVGEINQFGWSANPQCDPSKHCGNSQAEKRSCYDD